VIVYSGNNWLAGISATDILADEYVSVRFGTLNVSRSLPLPSLFRSDDCDHHLDIRRVASRSCRPHRRMCRSTVMGWVCSSMGAKRQNHRRTRSAHLIQLLLNCLHACEWIRMTTLGVWQTPVVGQANEALIARIVQDTDQYIHINTLMM